jgi:hypothetical protein
MLIYQYLLFIGLVSHIFTAKCYQEAPSIYFARHNGIFYHYKNKEIEDPNRGSNGYTVIGLHTRLLTGMGIQDQLKNTYQPTNIYIQLITPGQYKLTAFVSGNGAFHIECLDGVYVSIENHHPFTNKSSSFASEECFTYPDGPSCTIEAFANVANFKPISQLVCFVVGHNAKHSPKYSSRFGIFFGPNSPARVSIQDFTFSAVKISNYIYPY